MKITIDIDCTPQEARTFFGLPPIEAMQEALLAQVQERLTQYLDATDPEALLKVWLPGIQGFAELQEKFWGQLMRSMASATQGTEKAKD